MKLQVIVAPDFGQERGIDWILLSALLRRRGIEMDVRVPATLAEYDSAIALGSADLVLANPVDAIELVRRGGYLPVARPTLKQDEMYVACAAESRARTIRDLRPGCRIALTADRCVEIVGLRLLEPANLDNSNSTRIRVDTPALAAELVLSGGAEVAFFAAESHGALPLPTRRQLRLLVKSEIGDLTHLLLGHARQSEHLAEIRQAFVGPSDLDAQTASAMRVLGLELGFSALSYGETEDMLDLVEALREGPVGSASFP
ncbi:MAG: PhnD/SsuA/transferrin family substrate-binding protein [Piscinibacter sp.]|jgi:hypothetical protein|uniref:PhnD/SsuA/transferrin family substrate-binding protein n=1 Tax=Piscinibacter sp. TaxID=1903157 RepID=UPI00259012CC|nr:PhnD/SsuA/transferrin family substrate-binding protein [Piscinibacter sp.]MCW5663856.1 PhnD/SsuA/transferrin family substrate-binding protein [Piscinibacter sp.]